MACDDLLKKSKTVAEFKGLLQQFTQLADVLHADVEEGRK